MRLEKIGLVVVGAGPGGATAALCAAGLGKKVILVEQEKRLGGVCLNAGCIPSKALLHATGLIRQARDSASRGITFQPPAVDLSRLRAWKGSVLERLGGGIRQLAQKRGVEVVTGRARFEDSQTLRVEAAEGERLIRFEAGIIAAGSRPALPSALQPASPRIMTSTEALELSEIPERLLVVGGGYIGMELGTVYAALGSRVVLMEALGSVLPGADPDLVRPVLRCAEAAFEAVRLGSRVVSMAESGQKIRVLFEREGKQGEEMCDRVLCSVGRVPNSGDLGLENTKVSLDGQGFIRVNEKQQTRDPNLYAIGDVAGGALLAHKAAREARVAVEAIAGVGMATRDAVIPSVVFTDPEAAWCGLTEAKARAENVPIEVSKFSWGASGRAVSMDRPDGLTKLILEPGTERIRGVGIVGHGAGELISEGVLAIQMGARARDLAECVHPHPTLSETLKEAADAFYGVSASVSRRPAERAS